MGPTWQTSMKDQIDNRTRCPPSFTTVPSGPIDTSATSDPVAVPESQAMGRLRAAAGSVLFLAVALGVVGEVVPWLLTGWHSATPPIWLHLLGWAVLASGAVVLLVAFGRFVGSTGTCETRCTSPWLPCSSGKRRCWEGGCWWATRSSSARRCGPSSIGRGARAAAALRSGLRGVPADCVGMATAARAALNAIAEPAGPAALDHPRLSTRELPKLHHLQRPQLQASSRVRFARAMRLLLRARGVRQRDRPGLQRS